MGISEKIRKLKHGSPGQRMELKKRRRSNQNLVAPSQVTEQSLQVWRTLPYQIRHDPSMVSFQMENDRLHGSTAGTDDESIIHHDGESSLEDDHSCAGSEFINMKKLPKANKVASEKSTDSDGTHSDHEKMNGLKKSAQQKSASKERRTRERALKRTGLLIFWLFAAMVLMTHEEKHLLEKTLAVPQGNGQDFILPTNPTGDFKLKIFGAFNDSNKVFNDTGTVLTIQPQMMYYNQENQTVDFEDVLDAWHIPLVSEDLFDYARLVSRNYTFKPSDKLLDALSRLNTSMRLSIFTNVEKDFTMQLIYNPLIINVKTGTILAALILMTFYALLVWELFERVFIAIVCSILSVAVLACFNDRPNMEEIIQWMDMEMLTLLFCMMIIVHILTETGVFDYIAVVAFEFSGGRIWPMIYSLCFITCIISGFLDNVTTVLLLTPVAIRLCEVMSVNPVPVVMGIIVHANIGGSLTPIGDPISIIICSNHYLAQHGITFMKFVEHTTPGVLMTAIQSCLYLRFAFRDIDSLRLNEPKEVKELRREIKVWKRASNAISSYSKDADLVRGTLLKKVKILKNRLKRMQCGVPSMDVYEHTLEELKLKYPIKNKILLYQACGTLLFVIICFFIQSVPQWRTLPLGWVALLGVIALLIILNRDDMDSLMHRIEWTTLLFFAAMFVMMECVERLGLFTWIGETTESVIFFVDKRHRLAMAIFIILWMSALASSVLDSIPVTALMVKIVVSLVAKESLGLPLQPLVWAVTFGSSMGGNGTLYGASSNVISAGIAEQHGYKISFTKYLRTAFPMMLGQITIITTYLMIAHILFEWH